MFASVSGAPILVRIASDQASSFAPLGVWYSAVAVGAKAARRDDDADADGEADTEVRGDAEARADDDGRIAGAADEGVPMARPNVACAETDRRAAGEPDAASLAAASRGVTPDW
jgi:hypothetical protein